MPLLFYWSLIEPVAAHARNCAPCVLVLAWLQHACYFNALCGVQFSYLGMWADGLSEMTFSNERLAAMFQVGAAKATRWDVRLIRSWQLVDSCLLA